MTLNPGSCLRLPGPAGVGDGGSFPGSVLEAKLVQEQGALTRASSHVRESCMTWSEGAWSSAGMCEPQHA